MRCDALRIARAGEGCSAAANSGPGIETAVRKIDIGIATDIRLVMTCAMPQACARGRHDQLRLLILG